MSSLEAREGASVWGKDGHHIRAVVVSASSSAFVRSCRAVKTFSRMPFAMGVAMRPAIEFGISQSMWSVSVVPPVAVGAKRWVCTKWTKFGLSNSSSTISVGSSSAVTRIFHG
jgi:hypothetical protein